MTADRELLRKLSAYCMCLLMTSSHALEPDLQEAISLHLYAFEQMSFGSGKIVLNSKIPLRVAQRLPVALKEMQTSDYIIDT